MNGHIGHALAVSGKTREARDLLVSLMDESRSHYVPPYGIALILVGLGERETAMTWLERACADRSAWNAWLKIDPRLDSLRSDQRFPRLIRRAGMP
jgi:hypothetical protein